MDNLAHTLVGAALAETGLKKTTPLATLTLVIGANLADVDAVTMLVDSDLALYFRRGWTHGVLAAIVLPAVLAALMLAWDKWVRRRRNSEAEPARIGVLVGLSYLSFLTHPFLDWLNTYGVRLLMPFDGQWFYGDSLFIVDPWVWLLGAGAVVLANSHSKISIAGWIVLASAASALVFGYGAVPPVVKIVWGVGVGTSLVMRVRGLLAERTHQVAIVSVALMALYIAAMISGTLYSRTVATEHFEGEDVPVQRIMSGPVPGNPLMREGLIQSDGEYRYFTIDPLAESVIVEPHQAVPVAEAGPVVQAAFGAPSVRGMVNWMRFPHWKVTKLDDGWRVKLLDLRYADPDEWDEEEGFGVATVELDEDLNPR